jgi:signal transduction histidine kinase/DNA-binding response OmpR family regulator
VISYAKDAETGQRGYLLTGDATFLEPYTGAREKIASSLNNVSRLTIESADQQRDLEQLRKILDTRFAFLDNSVNSKLLDVEQLRKGKATMDDAREVVAKMQTFERTLLTSRTVRLNRFASITPIIIVFAALAALFITIYFYRKVNKSFRDNLLLTEQLRAKDKEISDRINIIQGIATNISKGDYKIRLNAEQNDGLGSLSLSLNKMADSLDRSFTLLSNKEWLQSGHAQLSDKMAGEKDISTLTSSVVEHMATYTNSQVGAFYLLERDSALILKSGYAFKLDSKNETVYLGEGIVGQCALNKKEIIVTDINDADFLISFGAGNVKPKTIVAFPVIFEDRLKGVIELGAVQEYSAQAIEFMTSVSRNIGVALNTAINRARLQELLEETQSQSEELQAQHSELENLNAELEAQAEKLQASEEELKVQQEELTETNQELNERSKLLEEKNELVLRRNSEIQKKSEELALSARYKSEFLANMSHELRTPLNSILLLSRLLGEDKNLKSEQVEYANVIQSSGNSLLLLIDDILDLSKIESGKMELEYENVSVQEIARDMQMIFEPLAHEKKIEFSVKIQEGLPVSIETDKLRLEQIIKNLASNALKFTNIGEVDVIFSSSERKDFIDISVKDTGIGIAADKQQLIFEAFQQADGSTRRKYGGTGLGLSISRQLALLLKGDITLSSAPGVGSTFTFSVPINKKIADEISITLLGEETPLFEEPNAESLPAKKEEIPIYIAEQIPPDIPDDRDSIFAGDKVMLIIEDDTAFAHALLDFTRKKGYKGIVAVRGDYGMDLARKYLPTGILLDIQLPVKSGWQVMDELKHDKLTRHIPVHIMSSFEAKKQSIMSGAIDFINKPMAFEQMDTIFKKIEYYLKRDARKVLIIEDNSKHAEALSYFLGTHDINSMISTSAETGLDSLQTKEVDCVILDMGVPDVKAYQALEVLRVNKGMDNIPVIIFTGKSLSRTEEMNIRKYADSIVVKTAHSYRRILDEVSLFLHLVEENKKAGATATGKSKPLSEILRNKTVLVADDDVRNIFSLTRALEQHQMHVIPAIDGREALQLLESKDDGVDIVLMDMMMPEMDGYETIANIRKNAKWKNLPVIAVTAKAMTGDREKCIQAGASDYISKPVDFDQLISLLRIWLYDITAKRKSNN